MERNKDQLLSKLLLWALWKTCRSRCIYSSLLSC